MTAIPSLRMKPLLGGASLLAVGVGVGVAVGRFTAHDARSTATTADAPAPLQAGPGSPSKGSEAPGRRRRDASGMVHDRVDELRNTMDEPDLIEGTWRFSAALLDLTAVEAASAWACLDKMDREKRGIG